MPGPYNPQAWDRFGYTYNNPIKYTDPSGHCVTNDYEITREDAFDCTVDEMTDLDWDVRKWWLGLLEDAANTPGWFNNIISIIDYFQDDPFLSDLDGWASYADAVLLVLIQEGYRQVHRGEPSYTIAGQAWAKFFITFLRDHEVSDFERQKLWGTAEQFSTNAGIALADNVVGRPEGVEGAIISAFVDLGNVYRAWLASGNIHESTLNLCISDLPFACTPLGLVEWFTDPRTLFFGENPTGGIVGPLVSFWIWGITPTHE